MVRRSLTLEQRVARLERVLSRKNEASNLGYELLEKFADELYEEVNLTSYKLAGHQMINTTKSSSGRIDGLLEIDEKPDDSTWNSIVDAVKRFRSENNCKMTARILHYNIGWFIGVTIKFDEPVSDEPKPKNQRPSRRYRSDDEDGYDYSDPEYRDMVKSAEWAESQREMGNY